MEWGFLYYNYGLVVKVEKNYMQVVEDFYKVFFYFQDGVDVLSIC